MLINFQQGKIKRKVVELILQAGYDTANLLEQMSLRTSPLTEVIGQMKLYIITYLQANIQKIRYYHNHYN